MEFEWDENKNQINIEKHHVSFQRASKIFGGDVLEWEDTSQEYGENRNIAIGRSERRLLRVVYTKRGTSQRYHFSFMRTKMTDEIITTLSFDELPADDESAWEQFDAMTDEEAEEKADPDNPPLTDEQLKQFRRAYYVKGEKVWEDEKTIGEWLAERGKLPTIVPVDEDIAEWFKAQGKDYQARINAALRNYIEANVNDRTVS
jgi:uncharacterized DUF497 family protein/uncharacterized protein (DUF4415 family)